MKTNLLTLALSLAPLLLTAQTVDEKKKVEEAIITFGKSADAQDVKALDLVLDKNFRVLMNQMFGNTETVAMYKEMYLDKIGKKEFGGEKREVKIEQVIINGKNASAIVTFKGSKMTFVSLLQLSQDANGKWKIVNDAPTVL
jgi:ketosteroid isomerase-like protein